MAIKQRGDQNSNMKSETSLGPKSNRAQNYRVRLASEAIDADFRMEDVDNANFPAEGIADRPIGSQSAADGSEGETPTTYPNPPGNKRTPPRRSSPTPGGGWG